MFLAQEGIFTATNLVLHVIVYVDVCWVKFVDQVEHLVVYLYCVQMSYWRSTFSLYSLWSSPALDTFHSLQRPKHSQTLYGVN